MTYQQYIAKKCEEYAAVSDGIFIGYNTVYGSRMYGTLANVEPSKCVEAPVAENLMMGMAVGMALTGMRPVVCFERHDFLLLALDALVNHADKLPWFSGGQFKLPIIVRAIVGGKKPIDPGPMHSQNYTAELMMMMKNSTVVTPSSETGFDSAWSLVGKRGSGVVVIVEYKDDYAKELCVNY